MPTGTFPRKTSDDGIPDSVPDFASVESATTKGYLVRTISYTPTDITCEYVLKAIGDGDLDYLRSKVKNSALFDDAAWAALSAAAKSNFLRTALQEIVKYFYRGLP